MVVEDPQVVDPRRSVEDAAEALIREARRRTRTRRLRVAAAAVSMFGVAIGIYLLSGSSSAAGSSTTAFRLTATQKALSPNTFALATLRGDGSQLGIYSARTGALVRHLGNFSSQFTNNGLAYSPDGRAVYFTLIPRRRARSRAFSLRLMRYNTTTRRSTFVADGAQPALNRTGSELAYAAFPHGLAVRDLGTGQTRTVTLSQLDSAANVSAGTVSWLGNDSDIAIVPSPTAWDLVGKPPKLRWCGTSQKNGVIVFVHVPPPPAALKATCVHLVGAALGGRVAVAPDPASASSALVTTDTPHGGTLVEQISQRGAIKPVVTIPDSLAISFDANGSHLLYLAGHETPVLTEATITSGRVIEGPWRDRHLGLGAAAW